MLFSPQIPLQLEPRRPDRFEDFIDGPNKKVVQIVRNLLDEPGGSLYLSGPDGSGKSHLLNALCHQARHRGLAAFYIALKHLPADAADGLQGLSSLDLVCIDDIDSVAGQERWEQALFRCFNEVRAAKGRLVVSSSIGLSQLPIGLPDLKSRLAWGVRQKLQAPGDTEKLEILRGRARQLQIDLPEDVIHYLLKHGRRDTATILKTLEQLKQAAFVEKRRITVPLARDVLSRQKQKGE